MSVTTPHNESAPSNDSEPVIATIDETGPVNAQALAVHNPEVVMVDPNTVEPKPKVVYVTVPHPPRKKANRLVGSLVALAAALVYAIILALAFSAAWVAITGGSDLAFIRSANFYIPVLFFAVALILLVLIANRAGWWAYIVGSIFVALAVYFGSAAVLILLANAVRETPDVAAEMYRAALLNPLVIIAGLLAREISMWAGLIISRRGRKLVTRNAEARAQYDREQAEREAEQRANEHPTI